MKSVAEVRARLLAKRKQAEAQLAAIEADSLGIIADRVRSELKQIADAKAAQQQQAVEQFRQRTGAAARAPTLSAPRRINTQDPQSDIGGDAPFAANNFGQAGGPQPGSPLQGGGGGVDAGEVVQGGGGSELDAATAQGLVQDVVPFLVDVQRQQQVGLEETRPGVRQFVPTERTITSVRPNVLTAEQAASIGANLIAQRRAAADDRIENLATALLDTNADARTAAIVERQILSLPQSERLRLEERFAALRAQREFARQKILTNLSKTLLEIRNRDIPPELADEAIAAALRQGSTTINNIIPDITKKTQSDFEVEQLNLGRRRDRLEGIIRNIDFGVFGKGNVARAALIRARLATKGAPLKIGKIADITGFSDVSKEDLDFLDLFTKTENKTLTDLNALLLEQSGVTVNAEEAERKLKEVANIGDNPVDARRKIIESINTTTLGLAKGVIYRAQRDAGIDVPAAPWMIPSSAVIRTIEDSAEAKFQSLMDNNPGLSEKDAMRMALRAVEETFGMARGGAALLLQEQGNRSR